MKNNPQKRNKNKPIQNEISSLCNTFNCFIIIWNILIMSILKKPNLKAVIIERMIYGLEQVKFNVLLWPKNKIAKQVVCY